LLPRQKTQRHCENQSLFQLAPNKGSQTRFSDDTYKQDYQLYLMVIEDSIELHPKLRTNPYNIQNKHEELESRNIGKKQLYVPKKDLNLIFS
jgi:hypothetical protein